MLTAKDIAYRLSISLASAYALLRSGQIPRYKAIGGGLQGQMWCPLYRAGTS